MCYQAKIVLVGIRRPSKVNVRADRTFEQISYTGSTPQSFARSTNGTAHTK